MTDDTGCDGEPVDVLGFDVIEVDNSSVKPGDDPMEPEFNGGVTHFTFDLLVEVNEENDWTAAIDEFSLFGPGFGLLFFEHGLGWHEPPDPDLFDDYPALEFDSFYSRPGVFPNEADGERDPYFAEYDVSPQFRRGVWFDVIDNGDGVFTIARYTIVVPQGSPVVPGMVPAGQGGDAPLLGVLTGTGMSADTWRDCNDFAFDLIVGQCRGDLDGDYDIDQADLGILLADWGCTSDCVGDLDGDDDTDQADLAILLTYWGQECP